MSIIPGKTLTFIQAISLLKSMSEELTNLGFHMSEGLYFKKVDNGIKVTKTDGKEGSPILYQQVESIDSMASALASCTIAGDTAEQQKAFVVLLSS